ncbi:importin beta like ARM repeat alpha superhelix [Cryptosporidium canis]|uniref:Importin beta like ARM repeat alpha superhelix n=1 Tax=Cryptosporidium canis TaxID=195482 RepID=A0A9D5HYK0_9CRYT|nr:importin beta like ARM repeat alpha superhelix [Cryptosporidium canis]
MSSSWQYDITKCQDVLSILRQADSSDSNVQLQVTNALNNFVTSIPDAPCYFALIFSSVNEGLDVRQRAGLLLKNYLIQYGLPSTSEYTEYLKITSFTALNDSQRLIRSTAGTIITTLVNIEQGKPLLVESLHHLSQLLDMATNDSIDGAFDCLLKVCEDELESCLGENSNISSHTNPRLVSFLDASRQLILPKLFQITQGEHAVLSKNETAVHLSFKCITLYAQHHLFSSGNPLHNLFAQYWQVIGVMAKQGNKQIKLLSIVGIVTVLEDDPSVIFDGAGVGVIIDFVLSCCEDSDSDSYNLRLEALEFWPTYLRSEKGVNILRPFLPRLLVCLLENSIFTDFDYIEMDPSHFEDKAEDDLHSIGPRFHQGRAEHDDSSDDEVELGAWGNQWTVRKASALALDNLSVIYGDEILGELLPKIEATLQDPNWEKQESAVLVLGAIARGCIKGLSPFLPKVLSYLVKLTSDSKPLIRSISCWCISRFTPWLALQQGQPILNSAFGALLARMLDPNKRVEEAACSATATFIEDSAQSLSLIPFLDDIIGTISRALTVYQFRNLLILCDTISTLCFSTGPDVFNQAFENNLVPLLITKWKSFPIDHPCLVASMDAVAKIFAVVGNKTSKFAGPVLEHCVQMIIPITLSNMNNSDEASYSVPDTAECALDLISSVIEAVGVAAIPILKSYGFPNYILLFCQNEHFPNIKQSAFACIGDMAKFGGDNLDILKPILPALMQILVINISNPNVGIANNAAWAIGELVMYGNYPDVFAVIEPIIDNIVDILVTRIAAPCNSSQNIDNLAINSCITIGRVAVIAPTKVGMRLGIFLERFFLVLTNVRNDQEKINAVQGICFAIQANQSSLNATSLSSLLDLLNSMQPVLESKSAFSETILPVLKNTLKSIYIGFADKDTFLQVVNSHSNYIQGVVTSFLSS